MGYTHYWDMSRDISERNFKKLTKDMKAIEAYINENKIVSETACGGYDEIVTLHDTDGTGTGVYYSDRQFCFNGDGSMNLDHESMHIRLGANDSWTFCKTARKPYDLAVCLILLSLKYHVRSTRVSSDGGTDDWQPAFDMWRKVFPRRKSVMFKFKKYKSGHARLDGSIGVYNLSKATAGILEGKVI